MLTVAKPMIDQSSGEADLQHVTIQRQILTGTRLLTETARRLNRSSETAAAQNLEIADIRRALAVTPVADTNLVELHAEGNDPTLLQRLVNTWIEVYLDARDEEVKQSTDSSSEAIRDEFHGLEIKITEKRGELDDFRRSYDIVSMEREENQILSRLKGLNVSLNTANEAAVKAKAALDAVKLAIAQGKPIVPDSEKRSLAALELRAQTLREQTAQIKRQYTAEYIRLQPSLKVIPEQLKDLDRRMRASLEGGKALVLSDAQQKLDAALQAVKTIQQQLNDLETKAAEFSSRFSEQGALQEELTGLETIYRETKERLVRLETKTLKKYPQVDVVDWAFLPQDPIRPLYFRDAAIALLAALGSGLAAVWLTEYLTKQRETVSPITLSGVHLYGKSNSPSLTDEQLAPELPQREAKALAASFPRELSTHEMGMLFANANEKGKHLIVLLLTGLTVAEAAALQKSHIHLEESTIEVPGPNARIIPLTELLSTFIQTTDEFPAWHVSSTPENTDELAALITCIAIDSGIPQPEEIDAESLRHTFLAYLIRQGLRLSEVEQVAGPLPASVIASYGRFSPDGPGISIAKIDLEYPGLRNKLG